MKVVLPTFFGAFWKDFQSTQTSSKSCFVEISPKYIQLAHDFFELGHKNKLLSNNEQYVDFRRLNFFLSAIFLPRHKTSQSHSRTSLGSSCLFRSVLVWSRKVNFGLLSVFTVRTCNYTKRPKLSDETIIMASKKSI